MFDSSNVRAFPNTSSWIALPKYYESDGLIFDKLEEPQHHPKTPNIIFCLPLLIISTIHAIDNRFYINFTFEVVQQPKFQINKNNLKGSKKLAEWSHFSGNKCANLDFDHERLFSATLICGEIIQIHSRDTEKHIAEQRIFGPALSHTYPKPPWVSQHFEQRVSINYCPPRLEWYTFYKHFNVYPFIVLHVARWRSRLKPWASVLHYSTLELYRPEKTSQIFSINNIFFDQRSLTKFGLLTQFAAMPLSAWHFWSNESRSRHVRLLKQMKMFSLMVCTTEIVAHQTELMLISLQQRKTKKQAISNLTLPPQVMVWQSVCVRRVTMRLTPIVLNYLFKLGERLVFNSDGTY